MKHFRFTPLSWIYIIENANAHIYLPKLYFKGFPVDYYLKWCIQKILNKYRLVVDFCLCWFENIKIQIGFKELEYVGWIFVNILEMDYLSEFSFEPNLGTAQVQKILLSFGRVFIRFQAKIPDYRFEEHRIFEAAGLIFLKKFLEIFQICLKYTFCTFFWDRPVMWPQGTINWFLDQKDDIYENFESQFRSGAIFRRLKNIRKTENGRNFRYLSEYRSEFMDSI